ncbi:MAG: hypothetical protein AAF960_10930 [Bacteroidota bacterium]
MVKTYKIFGVVALATVFLSTKNIAQDANHVSERTAKRTYCNPIDIDYTSMSHYRARNNVSYRSGEDPAVINFKGKYYLFVTRLLGVRRHE